MSDHVELRVSDQLFHLALDVQNARDEAQRMSRDIPNVRKGLTVSDKVWLELVSSLLNSSQEILTALSDRLATARRAKRSKKDSSTPLTLLR